MSSDRSSVERRKKEEMAPLKLGKAHRNHLSISRKNLSSDLSSLSKESMDDRSPVSEDSDQVYSGEPVKKCLSIEFASVSDASLNLSPASEVSDGCHSVKNLVEHLPSAGLLDAFSPLELTPTSLKTRNKHDAPEYMSAEFTQHVDSSFLRNGSVEAETLAEHLGQAWIQIKRCNDINILSKKLFHTLIKIMIEEFHNIPDDSDLLSKIIKEKTRVVVTCLGLWMMCTLVALYVKCHVDIPRGGPPST